MGRSAGSFSARNVSSRSSGTRPTSMRHARTVTSRSGSSTVTRSGRPEIGSQTDLTAWARFEARHPDAFAAMYVFWCEAAPGGDHA